MAYETNTVTCPEGQWTELMAQGSFIRIASADTNYEYYLETSAGANAPPAPTDRGLIHRAGKKFELLTDDEGSDAAFRANVQFWVKPLGRDLDLVVLKNDRGAG